MNEEEIYELISGEIESNSTKKGLWTKAFSESEGDEQKTRALYIKYRFDQINQPQPQIDQETIVKDDEEKVTEKKVSNEYKIKLSDRVIKEEKSLGHYYDSVQPPEKFGGFLLFLAYVLPIGFILAPLSTLLSLGQLTGMTYRANAEIKEAVRTFSGLTMIFQLCLTLVFVYLLYLFYKKKRNFPILYKWTIALNILTTFIFPWRYFGVLAKFSPYSRSELYWETLREPKVLIMLLSLTSIFIYFHFSTRVKKTFTQ